MKLLLLPACFLSAFLLFQCGSGAGNPSSSHDSKDLPMPADPLFKTLPSSETGITFENKIVEDFQMNVLQFAYLYNGGGVGILDVNNDGLQDVYFTATTGDCKLYQNLGNMKFKDITNQAGVAAPKGIKTGVCVVDINADGWQDIYLSRTGPKADPVRANLLFINNQNGTFTEAAAQYGLADISACTNANFFDYDNDGDLDVYVLVYPDDFGTVNKVYASDDGKGVIKRVNEPKATYDSDRLYRNNGNFTFTDVSKEAGIWNRAFGLTVNTVDFNNDGWKDIYVGNDYVEPDFYYLNNKNGTFTEQNLAKFRHTTENTMGTDVADLNNDGMLDLLALDMLSEDFTVQKERVTSRTFERIATLNKYGYGHPEVRNVMNLNNGDGSFSDVGCLAGIFQTDWSWSVLAQDYDNDGWKDLYITNGYRRDITNADYIMFTADSIARIPGGVSQRNFKTIYDYLNLMPAYKLQHYCYRNKGDLTYENVSTNWGFAQKSYANGAAYADLDNDGDLDMVVNNIEREAFVYQNTAADRKTSNWLQIKLQGAAPNTFAVGAKARITSGGTVQYQELTNMHGFLSSTEQILHFGTGKATVIDKVEIEFPGNQLLVQTNVNANQRLTLSIKDAKPGKLAPLPSGKPIAVQVTGSRGIQYKHQEDERLDFNTERLLPWQMSTPGASIATGDVNGDGRSDFYIGGASGTPGALFVQTANGSFSAGSGATWAADKGSEDTGAVFFDADGDKDQDLLVVSGGNAFPAGNAGYASRLYLNDGKGAFTRSADGLPALTDSGSAVAVNDFDGDGDLDVFIGGWCVPGAYPNAPGSHVLQNNGGKFADVTAQVSPDFGHYGMVRGMDWADLDGDNKAELIVVGEWAPVAVYKVNGGKLDNHTADLGLSGTEGFWRSVLAADVDGDGDKDLICGNLGLNTRLHASATEPLEIFAKDFDSNGSVDPLMTIFYDGQRYPLTHRDQIIKQIPSLKKKFVRYGPYAHSIIEEVYPEKDLASAQHLKANMLASVIFINNGGKFTAVPLPNEAQTAPVYGAVFADVNGDKIPDLITAGNDYGQQVETGRLDAGNGCILLGDGKGGFKPIAPQHSGFWADRDARDVALIPAGGKSLVLVSNSNDVLQVFEID